MRRAELLCEQTCPLARFLQFGVELEGRSGELLVDRSEQQAREDRLVFSQLTQCSQADDHIY
jgi:hypothetical protein